MNWLSYTRRSLYHVRRVAGRQRWVLAQALVLLPLVHHALRLLGFQRVYAALSQLGSTPCAAVSPSAAYRRGERVHRAMQRATRLNPEALCLPRSLVHWWLLRQQGLAAELRIGVRVEHGSFAAHAWVECAGRVINDRPDVRQRYAAFDQPIVPGRAVWQ